MRNPILRSVRRPIEMRLCYTRVNVIASALQASRSQDAVIRVYDEVGNLIETHEHKGDFKEG